MSGFLQNLPLLSILPPPPPFFLLIFLPFILLSLLSSSTDLISFLHHSPSFSRVPSFPSLTLLSSQLPLSFSLHSPPSLLTILPFHKLLLSISLNSQYPSPLLPFYTPPYFPSLSVLPLLRDPFLFFTPLPSSPFLLFLPFHFHFPFFRPILSLSCFIIYDLLIHSFSSRDRATERQSATTIDPPPPPPTLTQPPPRPPLPPRIRTVHQQTSHAH